MKSIKYIVLAVVVVLFSCKNSNKENESGFIIESDMMLQPDFPDSPRWIDDSEKLFAIDKYKEINELCVELFEKFNIMFMVHTVSEYKPFLSFNEYILALDEAWADPSNNYVIIVVSDAEMELRIINGTKTEEIVPSDFVENLINKVIIPKFRDGLYAEGVISALSEYNLLLSKIIK